MHAHLLDEEMGSRDLARTSLEVDHLCARTAALLAHVRPLLSPAPSLVDTVLPAELLSSLQELMAEHGVRGARLDFQADADLPALRVDREVLHHLLQSLVFAALEAVAGRGSVALRAEERGGEVAFVVEDDGEVNEDPAGWRDQMRRGRPLLCAVADTTLRKRGGHVEVARRDGRTRIELLLPVG